MKIHDDHKYHGAALTQIAEHPQFTAINAFGRGGARSRSGFIVNTDIGVYLKYATTKTKTFGEFVFTFNRQHLAEIDALAAKAEKTFVVFVFRLGRFAASDALNSKTCSPDAVASVDTRRIFTPCW